MAVWPKEDYIPKNVTDFPRLIDNAQPMSQSPSGLTWFSRGAWIPMGLQARIKEFDPHTRMGALVKELLTNWNLTAEMANELLEEITRIVVMESQLEVQVIRHPNSPFLVGNQLVEDYGIASRRCVTATGVDELVDAFQSSSVSLTYYWHALGLSSQAEATGDTALINEMTTLGYGAADRSSGTLTTGATANIFMTTATITIDNVSSGTPMVLQEHGIFQSSARGSTGLWDRSLTGTQTLSTGDSLSVAYSLTITAGG